MHGCLCHVCGITNKLLRPNTGRNQIICCTKFACSTFCCSFEFEAFSNPMQGTTWAFFVGRTQFAIRLDGLVPQVSFYCYRHPRNFAILVLFTTTFVALANFLHRYSSSLIRSNTSRNTCPSVQCTKLLYDRRCNFRSKPPFHLYSKLQN